MEILCEWVQLSEAAKENEYYQLQFQIEEMKFMCRMKECEAADCIVQLHL